MKRSVVFICCLITLSALALPFAQANAASQGQVPGVSCEAAASKTSPALSWAIAYDGVVLESYPPAYDARLEVGGLTYLGDFNFTDERYQFGKVVSLPVRFYGQDSQGKNALSMVGTCVSPDRRNLSCAVSVERSGQPAFSTLMSCVSPRGRTLGGLSKIDAPHSNTAQTLLAQLNALPDDDKIMKGYGCDSACPEELEKARAYFRQQIARDIARFLGAADVYIHSADALVEALEQALPEDERYLLNPIRDNRHIEFKRKL